MLHASSWEKKKNSHLNRMWTIVDCRHNKIKIKIKNQCEKWEFKIAKRFRLWNISSHSQQNVNELVESKHNKIKIKIKYRYDREELKISKRFCLWNITKEIQRWFYHKNGKDWKKEPFRFCKPHFAKFEANSSRIKC